MPLLPGSSRRLGGVAFFLSAFCTHKNVLEFFRSGTDQFFLNETK